MRFIIAVLLATVTALGSSQPATRLWVKTVAQPNTDAIVDMARDNAGNIYLCGASVQDPGPRYAMLIAKFTKDGIKQWERTYPGTSGHSVAYSIAIDPNGHPIVAGNTQFASSNGQSRILKVSAAGGDILYDTVSAASVGAQWYDLAVDVQGEATATGYIDNGAGKVMRTSHFLSNGTLAWSRDYSYPGLNGAVDQHGFGVAVDSSSNIYVCGVNNNFPNGSYNTMVKYSRTATQLWMKHYTQNQGNYPRGFGLGPVNVSSMGVHVTDGGASHQLHVVQFDANGTQLGFAKIVGGFNGASPTTAGFEVDPDGTTYWVGSSYVSGQLRNQFRAYTVPAGIGYTITAQDPDVRAVGAGIGGGDAYYATRGLGPSSYPSSIYGWHSSSLSRPMWEEKIFGSTANGQIAVATVKRILVDPLGDVYVAGDFSGAQSQDIFLAKYETGPVAEDDFSESQVNQMVSSVPGGFLANDGQVQQSSFAFLSMPQHGAFTFSSDGTYTYVPDAGFAGRDRGFYRFTRTNGTAPRVSEAMIEFTVYPNLTGATFSPSTLKGGSATTLTVTSSSAPNTDTPLSLANYPNWIIPIGTPSIWKDRKFGKLLVATSPVASTQNGSILVRSGSSFTTATLTATP